LPSRGEAPNIREVGIEFNLAVEAVEAPPLTKVAPKRRADGDVTRARLLETAGELFAARGYAETAAKSIASRAKVSLTSINYHFGGREGLYRAVLIEAHRRAIDLAELRHMAGGELPPAAKLRCFIDDLVRQATAPKPGWHVHVLAREILASSTHMRVLFESEVPPKLAIVKQILSDITEIPVDDPVIVRCLVSVIAPCSLLLLGARGAPGPLHDVRRMPRETIAAHLHTFALAGLEAIGRDEATKREASRAVQTFRSRSAGSRKQTVTVRRRHDPELT
jgi:AcrR family transcriptional regulator